MHSARGPLLAKYATGRKSGDRSHVHLKWECKWDGVGYGTDWQVAGDWPEAIFVFHGSGKEDMASLVAWRSECFGPRTRARG